MAWHDEPTQGDWDVIESTTRRGFTGHEHLYSVNLIHMNGQVYDPWLGQFLSADPVDGNVLLSQRLARFSYVMNSPHRFTDPSGWREVIATGRQLPAACTIGTCFSEGDLTDFSWVYSLVTQAFTDWAAGIIANRVNSAAGNSDGDSKEQEGKQDEERFRPCRPSENLWVMSIAFTLDVQPPLLPGIGGGVGVGVTSNGQFFLQLVAQGELGTVVNLSGGLQGSLGRNIGDLPTIGSETFVGVQTAWGLGPVLGGGYVQSASGNSFNTNVGRIGGGLAGQVAGIVGTETKIATPPICF